MIIYAIKKPDKFKIMNERKVIAVVYTAGYI